MGGSDSLSALWFGEAGRFGRQEASICLFVCMLIYISPHSTKNLRRLTTILLGICTQQRLKQRICTRGKGAPLGDGGRGPGGMRPARMRRGKAGEKAQISHSQGLPDLEVRGTASLSIMCIWECWGVPSTQEYYGSRTAGGAETHIWVSDPKAWLDGVGELVQGHQSL